MGYYENSGKGIGRYEDSFILSADGRPREEDVLRLIEERRNYSMQFHQAYFRRVRRWYDFYRGIYTGAFPAYRNNINIPLLFSAIWSDVSYKAQTSFGSRPYVDFKGYAPEDAPHAAKVAALVNTQLDDARTFEGAVDFLTSADIYGTSIARLGWRYKERDRVLRARVADMEFKIKKPVVEFDGPEWNVVDILDFWPQPGRRRIPEMDWMIHRFYLDLDDILDDQRAPYPMFDKAAVERLKRTPMSMPMMDVLRERMNIYRNFSTWQQRNVERYVRPVEIWEMWGTVPSEFAVNGVRDVVVTVANNRVVLRYEANPFNHGQRPFLGYCPCPDPHYFHGTGKIEIGEKMQAASNKIINARLDALELFMDPMFIASRNAGVDVQNLFTKPGRVFQIDGTTADDNFRPLQPNLDGMRQSFAEVETLNQYIGKGTGIVDDTVAGTSPGGRQTAREFLGRREASMTRLGLESRLFEINFVEPLANQVHLLNRQFLTLPKQIQMIGSTAVIDPWTGMPLPPEPQALDIDEIERDYTARAVGATQAMSKSLKAQNMMLALQAGGAHPVGVQITNWVGFFTELYRVLDLDPVEMIVQGQIPAINQMAVQQSVDPRQIVEQMAQGGMAGAGMTQTPQLEPSIGEASSMMPVMQPENVRMMNEGGQARGISQIAA